MDAAGPLRRAEHAQGLRRVQLAGLGRHELDVQEHVAGGSSGGTHGDFNVGRTDNNDWMSYPVNVPAAGQQNLTIFSKVGGWNMNWWQLSRQ